MTLRVCTAERPRGLAADSARKAPGRARPTLSRALLVLAISLTAGLMTVSSRADAPVTLAGTWSAGAMQERWNIGDWGQACGPKPSAQGGGAGTGSIREDGNELTITMPGRTFRTTDCWEQMPGMARSSHSASTRFWRTRCATGPNDPRQATIVTSISATDTMLSLDETGEYQFVIQGQNCTASVRRSRTFSLIRREGDPPPSAVAAPAPTATTPPAAAQATTPPPATTASKACAEVGDPARIEVRPSHKLLRPGDHFSFRTAVLDAAGCSVGARPSWSVSTASAKVTVAPSGVVTVADDATDGVVELHASIGAKGVRVTVEIASAARYEALLSAGGLNDAGEQDEAAVAVVATGSLGGSTAVAQDSARARKMTFVGIVGSLALTLAGIGFVLLRKNARARTDIDEEGDADGDMPPPPPRPMAGGAVPGVVCPTCRRQFPPGSTFCPHDGGRLVSSAGLLKSPPVAAAQVPPHAVGVAGAGATTAATKRGKICPTCGDRFGREASFCGKDGTALVLVN